MDDAVVGAGEKEALFQGGLGQGRDGVAGAFAWAGFATRQIGADDRPLIATVSGAKDKIAAIVYCFRIVRRQQNGAAPIKAKFRRSFGRRRLDIGSLRLFLPLRLGVQTWLDVGALSRFDINPAEDAVLTFAIDGVHILGIDLTIV